jgi:uncharacterized membrane protein
MSESNLVVHDAEKMASLKTVSLISYVLHLIVAIGAVVPGAEASVTVLLIAFVLDLYKKSDAAGTWQETHFDWRISSAIWVGALYILTSPLFLLLYFPGKLAWIIVSLWFLYRIVRGMIAHSNSKAMRT